ncbi:hypothetical protein [Pseudobutyrivibrio xylanivorans]|uniref:hypothetical protein n=1 Tax=Pseudobutyrivibrio xylanivorans TaxID=185007 RepID=UPI00124DAD98|nr:hypothetical protein [Pseudobutyrivibrio xylanivorans]
MIKKMHIAYVRCVLRRPSATDAITSGPWFMDSGKALEIIAMLIDRILFDFKPFLEFIQRKRLVIIVSLSIGSIL